MPQTILITAGKGGVGKSTVCAFLGGALAELGKSVLLLEGSHRSLDVQFGVSDKIVFDLSDVLDQRCKVEEAIVPIGKNDTMRLLCAPMDEGFVPDSGIMSELSAALSKAFDFILIESDGSKTAQMAVYASCVDRAVIVSTADPVSARTGRVVSDALDTAGVADLRLCVNMLAKDFVKRRPIPDLDWLIDQVCAQLIAVVPYDKMISILPSIGQTLNLSNVSKLIFDNFAQRILGNYIDLLVD